MQKKPLIASKLATPKKRKPTTLTLANLKLLRKEQKLTLEKLSKLTHISPSYLSRLETGARRFNTDILQKLSAVLGCHPSDLLDVNDEAYKQPHKKPTNNYVACRDLPLYELEDAPSPSQESPALSTYACDFRAPANKLYRLWDLRNASNAFAVYIKTNHMLPKYTFGNILYIHPTKPVSEGCNVLVLRKDDQLHIAQYEEASNGHLLLKDLSRPQKCSKIPNQNLRAVYRIIGALERPQEI